jgi:hypothetical protein
MMSQMKRRSCRAHLQVCIAPKMQYDKGPIPNFGTEETAFGCTCTSVLPCGFEAKSTNLLNPRVASKFRGATYLQDCQLDHLPKCLEMLVFRTR